MISTYFTPQFFMSVSILSQYKVIRDKTRLVVIDGLFGFGGSNAAMFVQDFAANSLIGSQDPVEADYIGTGIINGERVRRGRNPAEEHC
jgi:hypothetical protein